MKARGKKMKEQEIKSLIIMGRERGPMGGIKEDTARYISKDKKYMFIGCLGEDGKTIQDLATGKVYPFDGNTTEINGEVFKRIKRNDFELNYTNRKCKLAVDLEIKNFDMLNNDFSFLEYLAIPASKKAAKGVEKIFDFVSGEKTVSLDEIKLVDRTYNNMIHDMYKDLKKSFDKKKNEEADNDLAVGFY